MNALRRLWWALTGAPMARFKSRPFEAGAPSRLSERNVMTVRQWQARKAAHKRAAFRVMVRR